MAYIPTKKLSKQKINLTLDVDVIGECRIRGINISNVTNQFLKNYLQLGNLEEELEQKEIVKIKNELIQEKTSIANKELMLKHLESTQKKKQEELNEKVQKGEIIYFDG